MVVLGRVRRDHHGAEILHAQGADAPGAVVEVDERGRVEVLIGLADRLAVGVVAERTHERGVAGGEPGHDLAVTLAVGDFHPPVGEEGHHLGGAGVEVRGEGEADAVAGGGAHGSIVPQPGRECKPSQRNFLKFVMGLSSTAKEISLRGLAFSRQVWYHARMPNSTTNHEHEHFPCECHRPEYAYDDRPCPSCEEQQEREREAKREAKPTGSRENRWEIAGYGEERKAQDDAERDADNQAFSDAASRMSREDWDADNDWLASAGWGEM